MTEPAKIPALAALRRTYDGRFDDVSAAVLVVVPPSGRIVSVNVEAEELTGYDKAELEAMVLADIFRAEDRARIGALFRASVGLDFRKLFEHNVIVRKRSRRQIIVDMGFRRAHGRAGGALIFTLQDITDLKLNEERVARAHGLVNDVIHSITQALLVVDASGAILSVNAAARGLLGYAEAELLGRPVELVLPEAAALLGRPADAAADVETYLATNDGRSVPVLASTTGLRTTRPGQSADTVIVAMDISERKRAERLIAEQQMMIVQASKMSALGEMASSIAHEINNPLQVILGRCELLEAGAADARGVPELLAGLELIDKMSQRIDKIIRGLHALARDQRQDSMEAVDLRDIIRDTLALCEQRIRARVPRLDRPDLDAAVPLRCRPTQISQVLLNLLNNSYDEVASTPGAWIRLELAVSAGTIELAVTDSGPGVPAAVAAKLFTPFFTTKPVGQGTGIGLSVSRSLVESHGGTLELDTACANTRFVIRLPVAGDGYLDSDIDAAG